MKKLLTIILSLIIFLASFFVTPNEVSAGGTCRCSGTQCGNAFEDNCTDGQVPQCGFAGPIDIPGVCNCNCVGGGDTGGGPGGGVCAGGGESCTGRPCCSDAGTCTNVANGISICIGTSGGGGGTTRGNRGQELCNGGEGISTAIGCVPISSDQAIASFFLRWGLGIGGGIAFIMIVIAGYQVITSSGDPHRLQAGKELLTSALTGLMLLLFSAFILRFIGEDFLGVF